MKKRKKVAFIINLFIILTTIFLYSPSEDDYYEWLEDEYDIERIFGNNGFFKYTKDGTKILFVSYHKWLNAREQNFKYEDGKTFTIRSVNVYKTFFAMKEENLFWKLLNFRL